MSRSRTPPGARDRSLTPPRATGRGSRSPSPKRYQQSLVLYKPSNDLHFWLRFGIVVVVDAQVAVVVTVDTTKVDHDHADGTFPFVSLQSK
jgi:hypothetical protein